jgi:exodeoxyribonuclease VII large subunit
VQGEGAAAEVADGIEALDRRSLDLILVVRGGGAYEDLAAFNDERLARVIAGTGTPIVTGIGHEMDVTIADLVADARAPTPSAAAERAVPSRNDLLAHQSALRRRLAAAVRVRVARVALVLHTIRTSLRRVPDRLGTTQQRRDETDRRIRRAMATGLARRAMHCRALQRRLAPAHHRRRIAARLQTNRNLAGRLTRAILQRLERAGRVLTTLSGRLEALSPLAVLNRGYALVTRGGPDGPVITDAAQVAPGDPLTVRLSRGAIDARVETVRPETSQEETDGQT